MPGRDHQLPGNVSAVKAASQAHLSCLAFTFVKQEKQVCAAHWSSTPMAAASEKAFRVNRSTNTGWQNGRCILGIGPWLCHCLSGLLPGGCIPLSHGAAPPWSECLSQVVQAGHQQLPLLRGPGASPLRLPGRPPPAPTALQHTSPRQQLMCSGPPALLEAFLHTVLTMVHGGWRCVPQSPVNVGPRVCLIHFTCRKGLST